MNPENANERGSLFAEETSFSAAMDDVLIYLSWVPPGHAKEARDAWAKANLETLRLRSLSADVLTWIENYPLSERADTKNDWRQLAARLREIMS